MNYKKMLTSLTTSVVLLTSITGAGLTVFTEVVSADVNENGTSYVYTLKGIGDSVFSEMKISIQNMQATINTMAVQPHAYYSDAYGSILIETTTGEVTYSKDYIGNQTNTALTEQVNLTIGDYITVTHKESAGRLSIENETTQTALAKSDNTIYKVTTNGLVSVTKEEKDVAIVAAIEAANQAAAEKAINELFVNDLPSSNSLKGTVTNGSLDAAKVLFNKVTDPAKKASLQVELDKAQALRTANNLFGIEVQAKLKNLYKTENPNEIKDTTDQKTIDALQLEIDKVVEISIKQTFQESLNKAQALLDNKVAEEQKQVAAEKAINELFTNNVSSSNEIKGTTDQKSIDDLQAVISTVQDEVKKASLQVELDKAQALLNTKVAEDQLKAEETARQAAAEKAANELFTNNAPSSNVIKDTTDQKALDAVQALINTVTDGVKKASLQAELDKAQALLNQQGTDYVYTLKGIGDIVFSKMVISINEMQATINTMAVQPHYYFSDIYGSILIEATNGDVTYSKDYIGSQTNTASTEQAKLAIGDYITVTHKEAAGRLSIENETTQTSLAKDETTIYMVTSKGLVPVSKQEKDTTIATNKALEEQKSQSEAQAAVNQLFTNDTSSSNAIKVNTDQKGLDAVQALINKVTDSEKKASLQAELDKAQALLDAKVAEEKAKAEEAARQAATEKAANELFTNNTPSSNAIKDTTDQKALDAVQALINTVTDDAKKASLQAELDKAQALLNTKIAEEAARQAAAEKAVNELFTNNMPSSNVIKDITDQKALDAVQALINTVTDDTKKASLQAELDKAQALFNTKVAEEKVKAEETARQVTSEKAVNELFTNNMPSSNVIKDTTDQKALDAVQALINTVTDDAKKASLQGELDKAQALLNTKVAEEAAHQAAAEKAVNELFTNNTPSSNVIKDTTNQKGLDAVQALINTVTDDAKKASLQADLDKAQALLNTKVAEEAARQAASEKAANELFMNNTPSSNAIKDTTDQKAIDAVQVVINTVTDDAKKAGLQAELDKAQALLDAKVEEAARQAAAEKAANELFTNNTPSSNAIKDTTDQKALDAVQALINTVTDTAKKDALQVLVNQAKNLVAEENNRSLNLNEFQLKVDGNIGGTVSSNVHSIRVTVNGKLYTGGTLNSDGTFIFYARDKINLSTDQVVVSAYNKSGELIVSKNLTIAQTAIGKGTILPAEYQVGVDSNLIGTYTGDVNTIRVYVDGTEYKGGTLTKANGTFTFYLRDKVKNINQVVTIKGFDVNGNVISTNTVGFKVQTPNVGEISQATFVLGIDKYITGTYNGNVRTIRVFVDGTEYKGGTINDDGTFKFYAFDKIKSKSSDVKIIAYDANNVALSEKMLLVTTPEPTITPEKGVGEILPNAFKIAPDSFITGTYTGDVVKMKVFVDDVEYSGGTLSSDKTFTFYARGKITNTTQKVKVKGYDVKGNVISEKELVVTMK